MADIFSLTEVSVPAMPSARPSKVLLTARPDHSSTAPHQPQSHSQSQAHPHGPTHPQHSQPLSKPQFRSRTPPAKQSRPTQSSTGHANVGVRSSKAERSASRGSNQMSVSSQPMNLPVQDPSLPNHSNVNHNSNSSGISHNNGPANGNVNIPRVPLSALRQTSASLALEHARKSGGSRSEVSSVTSYLYSDWDDATSVNTASTNTRHRLAELEKTLGLERRQREETEKKLLELQQRQDAILQELQKSGYVDVPLHNASPETLEKRLRQAESELDLLRRSMSSTSAADDALDNALRNTAMAPRPVTRTKYTVDFAGRLVPSYY
eukprot:ANDGO_06614.mRNA.1 hypothetical protein